MTVAALPDRSAALTVVTPPHGCAPVELWWTATDLPDAALADLRADVDAATRARADAMVRRQDAARTLAAHALLRRVLAPRLGVAPDAVTVVRRCARCGSAEHGAPQVLRPTGEPGPAVSVAHAGTLAVVAVSPQGQAVGVDVERMLPDRGWSGAFHGVLTPSEVAAAGASADPDAASLRAWCGKEALAKATGGGLDDDALRIDVLSAACVADGWWQVGRPEGTGALLTFPTLGGAPLGPMHQPRHQAAVAVLPTTAHPARSLS